MRLNIGLLRKIQKHLKAEPKRYDQRTWGFYASKRYRNEDIPACGTQACIAGWAVLLNDPKARPWRALRSWRIRERAQNVLGLTGPEAGSLFSTSNQKYNYGSLGVAEACEKIDKLIASRKSAQRS